MNRSRIAVVLFFVAVGALLAAVSGSAALGPSGGSAAQADYVEGQVLVGYAPGATRAEQQQIQREVGAVEQRALGASGAHVLAVGAGNVESAIAKLRGHARVRYAEPNYVLSLDATANDPLFNQLWGLHNTGQAVNGQSGTADGDIDAPEAWDTTTGSSEIVVGVVDTGINYNHPDLAANMWSNPGGIGGCAAGTRGWNAVNDTCNPLDDHSHGSHVAGTIGAVGNNGVGVAGVAWNVKLMALKFLGSNGFGSTANAIESINFAITAKQNGVNVRVLNNSWGGGGFSQALLDAINNANANGILFTAAAGNSAVNTDTTPHYPSSYNAANVLSVAATTSTEGLASFSNYGASSVDIGAPGANILSTVLGSSYAYFNGTSMATPHVSGVAALALSACSLTTAQLKALLMAQVDAIPALAGKTVTGGRLNADKVVDACGGPPTPDYSLGVSPASRTIAPTDSTTYSVSINRSGGFSDAVDLSVSGLPGGATGSFSPDPAGGSSSTLTVTTSASPSGTYPLTITGVGGGLTRTVGATLVVTVPPTPDFTLSVSPTSRSVAPTDSTTYAVTITRTGGFSDLVDLSVSGLPAGASGSFSPDPASGSSSTLTVTTSGTPNGTYPLTITGVGGGLTRTVGATLVVATAVGDFSVSVSPTSRTIPRGWSTPYAVTIVPSGGFSAQTTLSVSGLPPGGSAAFSINPVAPNVKSQLRVFTSSTTPPGTYTLTVTGTSGSLVHSQTVTLVVT